MILILSQFINILIFYSLFDFHYKNLNYNEITVCPISNASSNRVVLFFVRGLSANLLYNITEQYENSFFRHIMENEGTWGISEGQFPSSYKSSFFRIITGADFELSYPWNVFQSYPNNVDNILLAANYTYAVGDKDDVNLIYSAINRNHSFLKLFKSKKYYYSYYDGTNPDLLLEDEVWKEDINLNNIIFSFIYQSFEVCAHSFMAHSDLCADSVKDLNKRVEDAYKSFNRVYKDNKTTFILTSGYGLSEAGQNGGGEDITIKTPILAWGSGIKRGGGRSSRYRKKHIPSDWKSEKFRYINQKDIASLVSFLLGNRFPNESVGTLPAEMINTDNANLILSLYCNEKQLWEIVSKQAQSVGNLEFLQKIPNYNFNVTDIREKFEIAVSTLNKKETIRLSKFLKAIHGIQLQIYRKYYKNLIFSIMIFIYIGWGVLLFERALLASGIEGKYEKPNLLTMKGIIMKIENCICFLKGGSMCNGLRLLIDLCFLLLTVLFFSLGRRENWPIHIMMYTLIAIFIWWLVFKHVTVFGKVLICKGIFGLSTMWAILTTFLAIGVIFSIKMPILRQIGFVALSSLYYLTARKKSEPILTTTWFFISIFISLSMNSSVINQFHDTYYMSLGGIIWVFLAFLNFFYNQGSINNYSITFVLIGILICSALQSVLIHNRFYQDKRNITAKAFIIDISKFIIYLVPFASIISSLTGLKRLVHICLSIGCIYILLTVRHESAIFALYCLHVLIWYCFELKNNNKNLNEASDDDKRYNITGNEFIRGFALLVYIYVGFFSTGNNGFPSFNTYWTSATTHSFDLIEVTSLIIFKQIAPMIILCSVFTVMYKHLRISRQTTVEWFLFLNNGVGLYFYIYPSYCDPFWGKSYCISYQALALYLSTAFVLLLPLIDIFIMISFVDVYKKCWIYLKNSEFYNVIKKVSK